MFARQPEAVSRFSRLSPSRWILAIAGITGTLLLGRIQLDPGHPRYAAAHAGFVVAYAAMMWSLVCITIGVFRKLCSRRRPVVRYVADSSYWMYLVHLPIVVWLQVAVAEVEIHWSLKLAFISAATIALSLLTYDLFVRSTFVGSILSGRRRPRVLRLPSRAPVLQSLKSVET
jgi:peptidoglycan/LPS O-acetylase OafA/YrhL